MDPRGQGSGLGMVGLGELFQPQQFHDPLQSKSGIRLGNPDSASRGFFGIISWI